jgi:hypothetical protein
VTVVIQRPRRQVFALLAAFGLGIIAALGVISLLGRDQEWGVVVTEFGGHGARLYGLFESKADCLAARTAFVEEYTTAIRRSSHAEKGSRTVRISAGGPWTDDWAASPRIGPLPRVPGRCSACLRHRWSRRKPVCQPASLAT